MLKNVERKHKNVKAASTVRVKANTVFKRERKVFILLLEDQVFQKLVDISLDSGTGSEVNRHASLHIGHYNCTLKVYNFETSIREVLTSRSFMSTGRRTRAPRWR